MDSRAVFIGHKDATAPYDFVFYGVYYVVCGIW